MPSVLRSCEGIAVTSRPQNTIEPRRGGSKPAIARSVVDFPAPFAPINATISPFSTR